MGNYEKGQVSSKITDGQGQLIYFMLRSGDPV
jgi:hypothetical protein